MDKLQIYLDDIRTPTDKEWIVVRSYEEFVSQIETKGLAAFSCISLDHDLSDSAMLEYGRSVSTKVIDYSKIKEKTGYQAAKYLVELSMDSGIPLPQIHVHSANTVGSTNIIMYINNYLRSCGLRETCRWYSVQFTVDYPEYDDD